MYVCMHTRPYACRTGTGDPMWCSVWRVLAILSQLVDSIPRPFLSICPHSFTSPIYWIYWCKYIHLFIHLPIDFQSSISSFIHDPIFSLCQKPGAARLRMTQQHRHKWRCDSDTSAAQCGKQKRFVWVTLGKVQNPSPLPQQLNVQKWSEHNVLVTFWLRNVLRATTACTFSTSWLPKVVREWCVLMHFVHLDFIWLRIVCFAPQRREHFFNGWASKSAPTLVCFYHIYVKMCFAPQSRTLFRHLNFPKSSEPDVFWTFCLATVLRETAAYNFWSHISPDGSAPATLASLLLDPPEPQNIRKTHSVLRLVMTFLPFRALWYFFFWLFLFSDLLYSSLLLSDSSHFCCFICPYIYIGRSLTPKIPSIITYGIEYYIIDIYIILIWHYILSYNFK